MSKSLLAVLGLALTFFVPLLTPESTVSRSAILAVYEPDTGYQLHTRQ